MFKLERKGGSRVEKGNYWKVKDGERVHLEEAGLLPGDESVSYLKFHPAALIVIGPLMGLVYAIFLPFAAIAMVLWVGIHKVFGGLADSLWKAAAFSWQPSEAYLAGRKKAKKKDEEQKAKGEPGEQSSPDEKTDQ
jgi:hypothetical protein